MRNKSHVMEGPSWPVLQNSLTPIKPNTKDLKIKDLFYYLALYSNCYSRKHCFGTKACTLTTNEKLRTIFYKQLIIDCVKIYLFYYNESRF